VRNTDYNASLQTVFSTFLLPRPSQAQLYLPQHLFSSTTAYVPPSVWETTFHAQRRKTKFKIVSLYILIFVFVDSKGKTDDSTPNGSKQPVNQSALNVLMTAVFIH